MFIEASRGIALRVLVLGASGFIGREVMAALLAAGHEPVAAVRHPATIARRFPGCTAIAVDLNRDTKASDWIDRLEGIDAVVNCAGALQSRHGQSLAAIHRNAPRALFEACARSGIKRVIQVSAIGVDTTGVTEFSDTKRQGDAALMAHDIDWVILRPSLVYSSGSYGGSSLLRGLAGLPGFIPLIEGGHHRFRPIHIGDMANAVVIALQKPGLARTVHTPVGPDVLTQRDILLLLRDWLDLPRARLIAVPGFVGNMLGRMGDILGAGPINSTTLRQMRHGNAAAIENFAEAFGIQPRAMVEFLRHNPSTVQDRWHARLYFAKPLLRTALALLWLVSGIAGLLASPATIAEILQGSPIPVAWHAPLSDAASILDLAIGFIVLTGRGGTAISFLQLAAVVFYTLGLSVIAPSLWLSPLGPLLKNIPILVLIGIAWMLEDEH